MSTTEIADSVNADLKIIFLANFPSRRDALVEYFAVRSSYGSRGRHISDIKELLELLKGNVDRQ